MDGEDHWTLAVRSKETPGLTQMVGPDDGINGILNWLLQTDTLLFEVMSQEEENGAGPGYEIIPFFNFFVNRCNQAQAT